MEVTNVLLSGIVGSIAYGLATEDSDVDRLGVYAAPTRKILGLHPPKESIVSTKPDITFHEAAKYVRLLLRCNPTVTELLWLPIGPPFLYEVISDLGEELIGIRKAFLSRTHVRNAYLGYATQQFRRLESRGDGSFSSDTRKRTAKHARHLARLVDQGVELHQRGTLSVPLNNPESYRQFGEAVAEGNLEVARLRISTAETLMDKLKSALPEEPDERPVEDWLQRVRKEFY